MIGEFFVFLIKSQIGVPIGKKQKKFQFRIFSFPKKLEKSVFAINWSRLEMDGEFISTKFDWTKSIHSCPILPKRFALILAILWYTFWTFLIVCLKLRDINLPTSCIKIQNPEAKLSILGITKRMYANELWSHDWSIPDWLLCRTRIECNAEGRLDVRIFGKIFTGN